MAQQVKLPLATPPSPIRAPVQVLAVPRLIQLPANAPGKETEDGPSTWAPATHMEELMGFLAPGFDLAQPWLLQPFWE